MVESPGGRSGPAVGKEHSAECRIFVLGVRVWRTRFQAQETAERGIHVAAADEDTTTHTRGKRRSAGSSVRLAHTNHVNHDGRVPREQILRILQQWECETRSPEPADV